MNVDGLPAAKRAEELQRRLGDPSDPDNPLGHRALLSADERGDMPAAGERLMDDYGLNAEFVPVSLGGRLHQADSFTDVMRVVFRRDATLGLGYGASSFIAALPVWTSGTPEQRRWAADLLLRGDRMCAGITELDHGGDLTRHETTARPGEGGFLLSGGKQLISNAVRSQAAMLYARTSPDPGSRSHTALLVDLASAPEGSVERARRFPTAGLRGLRLGGIDLRDCPVPGDAALGEAGSGLETILRSFQVTRIGFPRMATGILDTQLRTATGFAERRLLHGRPVADMPLSRSVLVRAFLDLLICDCLSLVAARALHVLPDQTSLYAAATKYLVPNLLQAADHRLGTLIGARSYLREGPEAVFQKNSRDLAVFLLGHASPVTCQTTIIPQLPRLARCSWLRSPAPPARLFDRSAPLEELDTGRLELNARGRDHLCSVLATALDEHPDAFAGEPELAALCEWFVGQLASLRTACSELAPQELTLAASAESFDLADRYVTLLAASACLGVWLHNRYGGGFLGESAWILGVLRKLSERLGANPAEQGDALEQTLFTELRARHEDARSFDTARTRLMP